MKILIVDDNEDSRLFLRKTLLSDGHEVQDASDGEKALESAKTNPPDMIISDILMPEMDGFRFCREVKSNRTLRKIPFIFYTATYTDPQDEKLALALGASRFVLKPVEAEEFLKIINSVIEKCRDDRLAVPRMPLEEEKELLRMYDSTLIRKLDKKITELNINNRALIEKDAELLATGERHKAMLNSLQEGIWAFDKNNKTSFINERMAKIIGYSSEEIIGNTIFSFIEDQGRELCEARLEKCKVESEALHGFVLRKKDGSKVSVTISFSPIFNNRGDYDGCISGVVDITDRVEAESALKDSEQKLKAIFDNAIDGILVANIENKQFLTANPAMLRMLGYSMDEVMTLSVTDIHPEKDLPYVLEEFEKQSRNEIVTAENIPVKRKDGSIFYADINSAPVTLGGRAYLAGIFRDISARKVVERALQDSEKRFRTIFESSPMGISIAGPEGNLLETNSSFRNMLGYSREEMLLKFSEITHPADIDRNMELFMDMIEGRNDTYTMEKRYIRKNGSVMWANLTATAVRDSRGTFQYNFAIIEDISERKRLEDQLRHAQKMEAVGQLAGGVAHDFNNLLTAITGYGNLLKIKLKDNKDHQHIINQMLNITERGASLTQGLLAFSRKQHISLSPVGLNSLIERMSLLLPRMISEEIDIKLSLSEKEMTVKADSSQLEQVLVNLAANARDAMPNGGTFTIKTGLSELDHKTSLSLGFGIPGVYAIISVTDTGCGMDESTRKKIFEPFFTTKGVGEGTGLGLSMAYGIIKQHNGYITVDSSIGKGSVFTIYLPLIKEEAEERSELEDLPEFRRTETVLLAEDELEVRESLKQILSEFGITVIEAVDGQDAVDKFNKHREKVEVLILDVVMPRKSGKEACEEIKKLNPEVKTIFISGYTEKKIHSRGLLDKDTHFISKPFSPRKILNAIEKAMTP